MAESGRAGARAAGTITIGGDLVVNRLGFGAMRLPGPRVWGEPADRPRAIAVLRRAVALGINLIDTAGYYGDQVSNRLIAEALFPYPSDLVIVTKVGAERGTDASWRPAARPEQIRRAIEGDLRHLRLERLDLVHCRLSENLDVPLSESLGALIDLQREGKVRHIGMSNISADQLSEAQKAVAIVSVQNLYGLTSRKGEDVLEACTRQGIPYMPFFPLGAGQAMQNGGPAERVAARLGVSPAQLIIAWLLARSPVMLPIPGTGSLAHLDENVAAAGISLSEDDMAELSTSTTSSS